MNAGGMSNDRLNRTTKEGMTRARIIFFISGSSVMAFIRRAIPNVNCSWFQRELSSGQSVVGD
jgi:hypothetical protein